MKKLLCTILTLVLFVATIFSFSCVSFADEEIAGTRIKNSNTYYDYDSETKTLYINGYGDIPNLSNSSSSIPWLEWDSSLIKNVVVSEGITSLGNYVFYQVKASSFILPRTLKRIGKYALSCTYNMKSWDIPYGIETIDSYAFYGNSTMESITIPTSVKTIGNYAFSGCTNLEEITIPSSVSSIGSYAFSKCSVLKSVNFSSLTQSTYISMYAFLNCKSLLDVTIPMNATLSTDSFGYLTTSTKVENFNLNVYENSSGYTYAIGNNFSYKLLDVIELDVGIENPNSFSEDDLAKKYHYVFTPSITQSYSIYSLGECDTYGELYLDGELIDSSDDISTDKRGFGITETLEQGKTYDLYVSTIKMAGDFSIFVFPSRINGFNVYSGSITMNYSDSEDYGTYHRFNITTDLMSDFVIDISFGDGSSTSMKFSKYIAGYDVLISDNQEESPFSCGTNEAHISLDGQVATYDFIVNHSYSSSVVAPTEDEDGYTLYTCVGCGYSYKADFVPTTAYTITGTCVMDEDNFGSHENNVPYCHASITVDGRTYSINSDGTWEIHTFKDCYAVFNNEYGGNRTIKIDVSNGDYDYGILTLEPYDLNKDNYVNAKDYAIYLREKYEELGENYWQFGDNYVINYK